MWEAVKRANSVWGSIRSYIISNTHEVIIPFYLELVNPHTLSTGAPYFQMDIYKFEKFQNTPTKMIQESEDICFRWSCFSMSHLISNRMKTGLFSISFSCFSLFSTWNNLFWNSPLMFYSFFPHTHGQTQFLYSTTVDQSTYRGGRFYIWSLCSEQLRLSRIKPDWLFKGLSSAGGDNLLLLMYSYSNKINWQLRGWRK